MSYGIAGAGWVTSLGTGLEEVWQKLMNGDRGEIKMEINPESGHEYPVMPVPAKYVEHVGRIPRLRRSSPISYFSVAAGLAALQDAGIDKESLDPSRTAVVFAVSNGAVVYTRRFYEQVVKTGANTASPMFFPETVYNAPASHLAAQLGIDGPSYTLVGDASVGISALAFAGQLLDIGEVDQCVVVGAEEIDWILCEAHHVWRLSANRGPMEVFQKSPRGTVLSEGAAAVVLSAHGGVRLQRAHEGVPFMQRRDAADALQRVYKDLLGNNVPDAVVCSANGSFVDSMEMSSLTKLGNGFAVCAPKPALGEAIGAGALMQIVTGTMALRKNQIPDSALQNGFVNRKAECIPLRQILVSCLGFNQQASGAVLSLD